MNDLGKLMRPFATRLANMLARGKLAAVSAGGKMQVVQLQLLGGEVKDRLEHFEPYGFTSHPHPGSAEAVGAFFDGDRSHGVAVVIADRKYRMSGFEEGEVAIHDDQGQSVHLTRQGIVVKGGQLPIRVTDTPSLTVEASTRITLDTPEVRCTGQLIVDKQLSYLGGLTGSNANGGGGMRIAGPLDIQGGSVTHDGKNIGATHTHRGVQSGGDNTGEPNA